MNIQGGVGELIVRLPSEIGAIIRMDTALVSVETNNLTEINGDDVNQAFSNSASTLTLNLKAGVSAVKLQVQ